MVSTFFLYIPKSSTLQTIANNYVNVLKYGSDGSRLTSMDCEGKPLPNCTGKTVQVTYNRIAVGKSIQEKDWLQIRSSGNLMITHIMINRNLSAPQFQSLMPIINRMTGSVQV